MCAMQLPQTHPGQILRTEFLDRLNISPDDLASSIGVPATHVRAILSGRRAISADTASRLATRLDTTPEFWVSRQINYDLALLSQASHKRAPRRPKLPRRRR